MNQPAARASQRTKALTELHADARQGRHRRDCRTRNAGDAAGRPDEAPSSTDPSSTGSAPADSSSGRLFGLDVSTPSWPSWPTSIHGGTLAGETVDVDQLVSAHPEQAEAFRKLLPILQGLAELEPVDERRRPRRPAPATTGRPRGRSSPTFTSSARSAAAAWGSSTRPARSPSAAGSP